MISNLKTLSIVILLFIGTLTSCMPPVNEQPEDPRTFSASDMNLLELGYSLPYFKDFMYSLEKTHLIYLMEDNRSYTVFAPIQQSFVRFRNKHGIGHLDQFPEMKLKEILLYHFIPEKLSLGYLAEGYHPTLLTERTTGNPVVLYIDKKSVVVLNGMNYIDEPDLETINGYMHSVLDVMEIPAVLDHLSFNSDFSLFSEMLNRQDLDPEIKKLLANEDPVTLMAPTDIAIKAFLETHPTWDAVSDIPHGDLNDLVLNHLVNEGNIVLSGISQDKILTTLGGMEIRIQVDYPRYTIRLDDRKLAEIKIGDIQAVNGIIHQIDRVIVP